MSQVGRRDGALTAVHLALHAPPLLVDLGAVFQGLFADHRQCNVGSKIDRCADMQLRTMSKNKLMTYLLQSPAYLLGYLAILGFGWSSGRFKDSVWHVVRFIGPMIYARMR